MKYLLANIDDYIEESFVKLELTKEQRKRAKTKSTLVSYCLLDTLLKELQLKLTDIDYENGKPKIEGAYISVTHKDKYVACSIFSQPIGIDLERIKDFDKNIMNYFFLKEEREYVLSKENQKEAFFTLFTIKESIAKLKGLGIQNFLDFNIIKENKIEYCNTEIVIKKIDNDYLLSICYEK